MNEYPHSFINSKSGLKNNHFRKFFTYKPSALIFINFFYVNYNKIK